MTRRFRDCSWCGATGRARRRQVALPPVDHVHRDDGTLRCPKVRVLDPDDGLIERAAQALASRNCSSWNAATEGVHDVYRSDARAVFEALEALNTLGADDD